MTKGIASKNKNRNPPNGSLSDTYWCSVFGCVTAYCVIRDKQVNERISANRILYNIFKNAMNAFYSTCLARNQAHQFEEREMRHRKLKTDFESIRGK